MARDVSWLDPSLYRHTGFDNQKTDRGFVGFFLRDGCPDFDAPRSIAAMVLPPPANVKPLQLATAWAIAWVPEWNASNSNTPTRPFQMTVSAC